MVNTLLDAGADPNLVETNEQGHPLRMKLTVVEGFRLTEIAAWAQQHLGAGTRVVSDGLACFHGVTAAGCVHEPVVVGSGRAAVERPEFRWVNTILGNIKNAFHLRRLNGEIRTIGIPAFTESGGADEG